MAFGSSLLLLSWPLFLRLYFSGPTSRKFTDVPRTFWRARKWQLFQVSFHVCIFQNACT